jgi:plastocyanin
MCLLGIALSGNVFAADATITAQAGNTWDTPNVVITQTDTVTWTNLGSMHNVAESDNASANFYNGSGFRSGAVGATNTHQETFFTPGIYYYICEPHAGVGMKGSITVNALPAGMPMPTQSNTMLIGLVALIGAVGIAFVGKRYLSKH